MSNEHNLSEQGLKKSHHFLQSAIDVVPSHLAILDEDGLIITVNKAWRQFADANGLAWGDYGVDRNYLEVCEFAVGDYAVEAPAAFKGIQGVMTNQQNDFSLEYPCHSPAEQRWFLMYVASLEDNRNFRILVTHLNITGRKLAEEALQKSYGALELWVEEPSSDLLVKTEQLKQEIRKLKKENQKLRENQTQLIQDKKMEALGKLIAVLVHEITNPNSIIIFNIPILRDYIAALLPIIDNYACELDDFEIFNMVYSEFRDDLFKTLNNIENGSIRINYIMSDLKKFIKNQDNSKRVFFDLKKELKML